MTRTKGRGMGRREFLLTVGVAASTAVLGGAQPARAGKKGRVRDGKPMQRKPAGPEVEALFGPLRAGRRLGPYTIVAVCDLHLGAIPVVLRAGRGEPYQVDVLRRDPARAGVAATPSLGLYLAGNDKGGRGSEQTDEARGLGAMALAAALARREAAGAKVPSLLTHEERVRRHPDGIFDVLG